MSGFFGVASKEDCVFDLFFGTDYHSHLGTRRAGLAVYDYERGFDHAVWHFFVLCGSVLHYFFIYFFCYA